MTQNINDIIKQKEKELQQYQQIRIAELENLIEERNNIIFEYTKKFNLLKEDFNFNLQLIEARDEEIKKLEDINRFDKAKFQELVEKHTSLEHANHSNEQTISQLEQKLEEEKGQHKVMII